MQKTYPTAVITITAYLISFIMLILLGVFFKNSLLAAFVPSCILVARSVFSCITQEKRNFVFALFEGTALFMVIRLLPVFFS